MRLLILVFALVSAMVLNLSAATDPAHAAALSAKPNAAEATFIAHSTATFMAQYATADMAVRRGFYQMTPLEKDGTSIYFNDTYKDVDALHPNFLWYDRHGKLVGLDFEVAVSAWPKPPGAAMYPVQAARWTIIPPHLHFAYKTPSGKVVMRGARIPKGITGGPITAGQLRAAKLLPAGTTLVWAHFHPKTWDLGFWLVPNPNGAFADLDPLVK
jgi:hypothetical protein